MFFFTKKCEVAEESSEQVHDKHGQDGDVGDGLHALLGSTGVEKINLEKQNNVKNDQESLCKET